MDNAKLQQAIKTKEIVLKLEAMYQKQISQGFGILSEPMKEYAKTRNQALRSVARMTRDGY